MNAGFPDCSHDWRFMGSNHPDYYGDFYVCGNCAKEAALPRGHGPPLNGIEQGAAAPAKDRHMNAPRGLAIGQWIRCRITNVCGYCTAMHFYLGGQVMVTITEKDYLGKIFNHTFDAFTAEHVEEVPAIDSGF